LPLAIELAAARIRFFTSESLLARLDDRLAILTGGTRDAPSRQRTMRSAIQWSHDLLARDEQVVFRRLSLLRGTFALQTAIEILDFPARDAPAPPDVLECLLSLLDKNLIIRVHREDRFRMLATIREFGMAELERSGETDLLRERMLRFYVDLLASQEVELIGPNQHLVMRRLDAEVGNLRVALQAGLDLPEPAGVLGLRLASMLWRYWLVRGQLSEGSRWLSRALNLATGVPVLDRASALNRLGNLSLELSQYDKAQGCYQQSFELYQSIGDKSGMGDELNNLGLMELIQGKFDSARVLLERSQALRQELGDTSSLPSILTNLGDIATYEGDYDAATAYQTEALVIRRSLGNKRGIALCCSSLGTIALLRGELDEAERWFAEGMTYSDELDDAFTRASMLLGQGRLAVRRGMIGEAVDLLTASLRILQPMGSRRLLAEVVDVLAATGAMAGHHGVAARLTGSTTAMREEHRIGITARSIVEQEDLRTTLVAQLGADGYGREVDSGRRLMLDAAVGEALELAAMITGAAAGPLAADGVERGATEVAERFGLTRREREVLVLLVEGLGDKEIADHLFISPRTAMTHVGNILAKLGVNRRAMAARVAIERGLVASPTAGRPPDQTA
jgi:non-specific serine/threonine protein kinase